MCIVHMRVQCSDKFTELLVGNVEDTELTIESIVGTALLEIFAGVKMPEGNRREVFDASRLVFPCES